MGTINDFLPWDLPQYSQWREQHGRAGQALRGHVSSIAQEAVQEIVREVPEYVRPDDLRYADVIELAVTYLIGQFVELINDASAPMEEILDFFYGVGYGEAAEGRSLDTMQKAIRLGARVAVRRLTEAADLADPDLPAEVYGGITGAIFPYLELIMSQAAKGHAHALAKSMDRPATARRKLADLLLSDSAPQDEVRDLARRAGWQVPRTVAVVALEPHDRQAPGLPAEVLSGLHRPEPCLIVPDPEGPGRRQMLDSALRDRTAALGPTVAPAELGASQQWARQALELAQRGILPGGRLLAVTEHMPTLVILRQRDLVGRVGARRLKPLTKARPGQRRHLAETLLACLECGFNATLVATHLHLHPQTVRYRLRQLKDLFGDSMYDPSLRLELQMVLHAWLAAHPAQESVERSEDEAKNGRLSDTA